MKINENTPTKSWHVNFVFESEKSDICNVEGESVTDKSDFRPEIATVRDKALALIGTGAETKRVGLYDSDLNVDEQTIRALAYARGMNRDITEIEAAKQYLENYIENAKDQDKANLKAEIEKNKLTKTFEKIAENTKPKENTEE